jgi:hypothetical protein
MKSKKSHWNYRVMANKSMHGTYLSINEVYYTNGIEDSYIAEPKSVCADDMEDIALVLYYMQEAGKKPILWAGDKFPKEAVVMHECYACKFACSSPTDRICTDEYVPKEAAYFDVVYK